MRRKLTGDAGLTLIELAIAVLILSLGTLAALRAVDQSRVAIGGMTPRALAMIVAQNRAQELHLYGGRVALPDEVEMGGQRFDIATRLTPSSLGMLHASITVRGPAGPGAHLEVHVLASGNPE